MRSGCTCRPNAEPKEPRLRRQTDAAPTSDSCQLATRRCPLPFLVFSNVCTEMLPTPAHGALPHIWPERTKIVRNTTWAKIFTPFSRDAPRWRWRSPVTRRSPERRAIPEFIPFWLLATSGLRVDDVRLSCHYMSKWSNLGIQVYSLVVRTIWGSHEIFLYSATCVVSCRIGRGAATPRVGRHISGDIS